MRITTKRLIQIIREEIEEIIEGGQLKLRQRKVSPDGNLKLRQRRKRLVLNPEREKVPDASAAEEDEAVEDEVGGQKAYFHKDPKTGKTVPGKKFKGIKFPAKGTASAAASEEAPPKSKVKMDVQKGIQRSKDKKAGRIADDDYMDRMRAAGLAENSAALEERVFRRLIDEINKAKK